MQKAMSGRAMMERKHVTNRVCGKKGGVRDMRMRTNLREGRFGSEKVGGCAFRRNVPPGMSGAWRAAVLCVLCLALGAEFSSPPAAVGAADTEAYINEVLTFFGGNEAAVRAKLGEPRLVRERKQQNRHDASLTDVVVTLLYPEAEVSFYRMEAGGELPLTVRVFSPKMTLPGGLRVGSSLSQVRALLGEPTGEDEGVLLYETESGYTNLVIRYYRDAVTEIEANSWPD
jgi:hypothetical protein